MKFGHLKIVVITSLLAVVLCFQTGCSPGMLAVIGTPTSAETTIPAELDLAQQKDKKILVFVDQPSSLNARANLRFFLTDTVSKILQQRMKIQPQFIVDYDTLADFRSGTTDFYLLSPQKVGSALGTDLVLLIVINDCRLPAMDDAIYSNGFLSAQAQLVNVSSGEKLWPALEPSKTIKVGFESERRGPDAAAVRLAVAAAHCVTRYLYNCPKNKFRISDEITDVGWENK